MMPGEQRSDAGMVVAAWRAIGSPSASTTDPFDGGAVPSRLILRPARRCLGRQLHVSGCLPAIPRRTPKKARSSSG
jgi:hypothetical protein